MPDPLPAIERSNGKAYQPRKLVACAVNDSDESLSGVVVFGTHDPGRARQMADDYAAWQIGSGYVAVDPVPVWWRDGFDCGSRAWITDDDKGRAGVWFREVVERTMPREMAGKDGT